MKHEPLKIEKLDKITELLKQSKTDDGTFFDALYNLILFIGLKKSEHDILNGKYCSLDELKSEMEELYEGHNRRLG